MQQKTCTLEEKEKLRTNTAALGVGIVCLVIGLPLWWKTTEIYRVQLPYSDINKLSQNRILYAVNIEVISFDIILSKSLPELDVKLQASFAKKGESLLHPNYEIHVRDSTDDEKTLLKRSKTFKELDALFWNSTKQEISMYTVLLLPEGSPSTYSLPVIGVHGTVGITVNNGKDDIAHQIETIVREVLVREGTLEKSMSTGQGLRSHKPDKDSMRWVRAYSGYDVTFTLVNPQPDFVDADWNIQEALYAYLNPFLEKMSNFTTVHLTSQVLYYAGLVTRPHKGDNGSYFYTEQDLPLMINPLETKLGSHASNNPTLNFVVYIPTRDNSPLFILDENEIPVTSNAFLSPRWGGVMIYNVDVPSSAKLPYPLELDMHRLMEVFLTQIRLLLNIEVQTNGKDMITRELGKEAITDWELTAWLRCRCIENLATAKASLKSLAQLLGEIRNIVINDEIGKEVEMAVEEIKKSEGLLASGQIQDAYRASSKAATAAEKAFFDPSLLELLYFPEDQKFAIYIPLFLPIGIPVVTAMIKAIKWFRQRHQIVKAKTD
ncbi:GPI transamidase component PIG-S-like [Pomacea canaliculata]|uniref:GPI transamidase component PIG-S-like n=1 Tax=Pomacea canaliculata TaxID=400727 RepID=UPI000D731293|nr:GPI transamidase component PIG-S-like [Pomacea canaliculata]